MSATIGISVCPDHAASAEALLRNGTIAVSGAKEGGERNTIRVFSTEMRQVASGRFTLEAELRRGIESGELFFHFQPQFEIVTGRLAGAEALIRWRHPARGLLLPKDFLFLAEETGLIFPIGAWTLETTCALAHSWRSNGARDFRLAVNVTPRYLQRFDFLADIRRALDRSGLPAEALEIEITENQAMQNPERTAQKLRDLARLGVRISLDDFGTGYSSLGYLTQLPLHELKIDQSFVRELPEDEESAAITKAIIALAKSLGLHVVGEGVETSAQLAFLRAAGCDQVQGFLLGRPVPAEEFARLLETPSLPDLGGGMAERGSSPVA